MKKFLFPIVALMAVVSSCIDNPARHNPKVFDVEPSAFKINSLAQRLQFEVNCDKEWSASMASGSWARLESADPETGLVSVSVTLNETSEERADTVIVQSGTLYHKVPVIQQGMSSVVSETHIVLTGTESKTVTLNAPAAWVASVVGGRNGSSEQVSTDPGWLTISPASGKAGASEITLCAKDENLNVGDRTALVKVTTSNNVFYLTVVQKQTDAILKDRDKFELSNGGQDITIHLQTNVNYSVEISADWVERLQTKALNQFEETFRISANRDEDPRSCEITFKSETVTETVTIWQAECDVLAFVDFVQGATSGGIDFSAEGGEGSVDLRSNVEYEIVWPAVDWITPYVLDGKSADGRSYAVRYDELRFIVSPNYSLQPREAVFTVYDKNSALSDTFKVVQEAGSAAFAGIDVYGLYLVDGTPLAVYTKGVDQTGLYSAKDGQTYSFRIQDPVAETFLEFGGVPVSIAEGDGFGITLNHNQKDMPVETGTGLNVVAIKVGDGRAWLYSEDGYGLIIKK